LQLNNFWLPLSFLLVLIALISLGVAFYISRVNQKLRASRKELRQRILAVFSTTDSLILSLNEDTGIRFISDSASDFFKKWIGIRLYHNDNLLERLQGTEGYKEVLTWHERSREVKSYSEVKKYKLTDRELYLHHMVSSIRDPKTNEYLGLIVVANDITLQQQHSKRLVEQRDKLAESDQTKEKLLSILAHDLKDSVYSAHTVSGLVHDEPENFSKEELLSLFDLMHNNFERTKDLLEELLVWIRSQSDDFKGEPEKVSLYSLVADVEQICEPRVQAKNLTFEREIPKDLMVLTDPKMIKTVLRNLLSNACKFSEANKGRINVYTVEKDNEVEVHVKDNGIGMSEKIQQKLRISNNGEFSTPGTNNEIGTGFGLSLSKQILEKNNSKLKFRSSPGEGSDFYFSLPLAK